MRYSITISTKPFAYLVATGVVLAVNGTSVIVTSSGLVIKLVQS